MSRIIASQRIPKIASAPRIELWRQAEDHFKTLIHDGVLQPGQRLPTHEDLGALVGVGHSTLQRALQSLTKQGYIVRHRRRGSFIAEHPTQTREQFIAVMTRALFDPAVRRFDLLAARALVDVLADAKQKFRVYHNQFTAAGRSATVQNIDPQLVRDVERGRIRGVLVLGAIPPGQRQFREQLAQQNIPVVEMSLLAGAGEHFVVFDYEALIEQAVARVKQAGAKSVGLIGMNLATVDARAVFSAACKAVGLTTNPAWQALTDDGSQLTGAAAVQPIFAQRTRPDALVILDDVMAQGALMALLGLGVRVPADARVVTHANRGADLAYPAPVEQIEFDPNELVTAGWRMLADRLAGKPVPQRQVRIAPKAVSAARSARSKQLEGVTV